MPEYFSHPDRTLREHLYGLKEVVGLILGQKVQDYWTDNELEKVLLNLIAYHDIAKATPFFQFRIAQAIKEENHSYYQMHKSQVDEWISNEAIKGLSQSAIRELSRHTLFGATVSQQLFLAGKLSIQHLIFFEIIRAHHGNLKDFSSVDFTWAFDESMEDKFSKQFENLQFGHYFEAVADFVRLEMPAYQSLKKRFGRQRKINHLLDAIKKEKKLSYFLQTLFLYSLLLSADKGDVMLTEKGRILKRQFVRSSIIDEYKQLIPKCKKIDALREEAYQTVIANLEHNLDGSFFCKLPLFSTV